MKKLILCLVVSIALFGACVPVYAMDNNTSNASVQAVESKSDEGVDVGFIVLTIIGIGGMILLAFADTDVKPKDLLHSNFTGIGRLNNALEHYSKKK